MTFNEEIRKISSQCAAENEAAKLNRLKYESLLSQEEEKIRGKITEIERRLKIERDKDLSKTEKHLELKYMTNKTINTNSARFCMIWSIAQAIGNKWISQDFWDIINFIKRAIITSFNMIIKSGDKLGSFSKHLRNPNATEAVNGILHLLTWLVMFLVFYGLPILGIVQIVRLLVRRIEEDESKWVLSVSTVIVVVLACMLTEDPKANLIIIWGFIEIIIVVLKYVMY